MSELNRENDRWIEDTRGRRWRVELAPPEPLLGTGLGIAPAVQDPQLRSKRLRFTPQGTGETLWGRESYAAGIELEAFTDAELVAQLAGAHAS